MKEQKGITLIALVITIIVLLILAGVSIAMLTGENGILTKATTAKEKSLEGEVVEAIKLGIAEIQADKLDTVSTNKTTDGKLSPKSIVAAAKRNNSSIAEVTGETYAETEITAATTMKVSLNGVVYEVTYTPASGTGDTATPATITATKASTTPAEPGA